MFLKNVHVSVPKENVDPYLSVKFDDLNERFFNGMLDKPNLMFGEATYRKLGSYEYGNDTIIISSILKKARQELLEYVLYHEMLHKKLKYDHNKRNARYHTKEFKDLEKKFPDSEQLEKELNKLASRKRFFGFI